MRYVVYGDDAMSRRPRAPLVVEAGSEDEARGRAVAGGMAVRAIIAENTSDEAGPPAAAAPPRDEAPSPESEAARGMRRTVLMVVVPLAILFFLIVAAVRTLLQAASWSAVWSLGVFLGCGMAGVIRWSAGGAMPVTTAWPIGLAVGLAFVSALHGAQVGWRWWWAKRSLSPLAQALGVAPEETGEAEPRFLRVPVTCAQGLAGLVLGGGGLAGWATDWSFFAVFAWTAAGALGLGVEGAILGAILARRRPVQPDAAAASAFEGYAGLLARLSAGPHLARNWIVGYALDRAVPGAVAGTFIGILTFLLGWWLLAE